jgi:hypothetical protein
MKELAPGLFLAENEWETTAFMSGSNLAGAVPTQRLKPSNKQTPSGIEPDKKKSKKLTE